MHFISASNDISKIIFNPREETLALGDFIKFTIDFDRYIISQVTKIKTIKENEKFNLAISKNVLMLDENIIEKWQGLVPAVKAKVEKIPTEEILFYLNPVSRNILIGKNNDENIYCSIEALKKNTFVFADAQESKVELVKTLSYGLLNNNKKVVIFDFLGEFKFEDEVSKIVAADEFKLLLNSKSIDSIYEKGLKDALIETRAVIEDIFVEVKNYLKEDEANFIPFNSFKDVIASEKSVAQLSVLKNQLDKYDEQNIFANSKSQFDILKEKINEKNLVVVDFSKVPTLWIKEFVESILNFSFEKEVFCFFDIKENIFEEDSINSMVLEKEERNIYPIISLSYSNKLVDFASYLANNSFLFNPNILIKQFVNNSALLMGLSKKEFLYVSDEMNNVTLKATISEAEIKNELSFKNETIQPLQEEQELPYEVENIFDINQDETQETEEQENFDEDIDETNDETDKQSCEIDEIELVQEDDFDFDELDLDALEEDEQDEIEEIQKGQTEIYQSLDNSSYQEDDDFELIEEDDYQDNIVDEISEDVESLYTSSKNDDFSNNTLPIYKAPGESSKQDSQIKEGDDVAHQKYGIGVVKKIINYGEKTLLSIQFDKAGRRLLDPNLAGLEKINAG